MSNLSLYQIETELQELLDLRENVVAAGELPETVAAIDSRIQEYIHREVKKVDGICAMLRAFQDAAARARNEAERIFARVKAFEAQEARLRAATLAAMRAHGVTKLETPENTLRIQGNGGLEPIELEYAGQTLEYAGQIPSEFVDVEVWMPQAVWDKLCEDGEPQNWRIVWHVVKQRIREALKQRVKCPECDGDGKSRSALSGAPAGERCPRCEGKGTVPAAIPGAKLLPRTERLVVE
jgi:Gp157 protein